MANGSELYASARIAAREREFLSEEDFARLDCAACDRLLAERGRAELFGFFSEICTKPDFLQVMRAKEDAFNAKCALKFRATGNPAFRALASAQGTVTAQTVFECVSAGAFRDLPDFLRSALSEDSAPSGAREIDTAMDFAFFKERARLSRKLPAAVRTAFALEVDLLNLEILFRCRALGESASPYLLEGGEESAEIWRARVALPSEDWAKAVAGRRVSDCARKAFCSDSPVSALSGMRKNLFCERFGGIREGFLAQVGYWFRREAECARIRRVRCGF